MAVLSGIVPVFLLVGLGALVRRLGWANDGFVRDLNRIIYWFAVPALLFRLLDRAQLGTAFSLPMTTACVAATATVGAVAWAYAAFRREEGPRLGVIVQATVRGNLVFMAFPVIYAAAGDAALTVAAVTAAVLIPFQNLLAVAALVRAGGHRGFGAFKAILLNPVVLGVIFGILSNFVPWQPWTWLDDFLRLLGNIAMPGALLALGAQMGARTIRESTEAVTVASFLKIAAAPALCLLLMSALGVEGLPRLVGLLLLATPTAVASTVVAQEMGGDIDLAGACVMATTLASFPTYLVWGMVVQ